MHPLLISLTLETLDIKTLAEHLDLFELHNALCPRTKTLTYKGIKETQLRIIQVRVHYNSLKPRKQIAV